MLNFQARILGAGKIVTTPKKKERNGKSNLTQIQKNKRNER